MAKYVITEKVEEKIIKVYLTHENDNFIRLIVDDDIIARLTPDGRLELVGNVSGNLDLSLDSNDRIRVFNYLDDKELFVPLGIDK